MKKQFTFLLALALSYAGQVFAGGPSAGYRFDATFGNNGFLIDTTTGGSINSYIYYNEIMVSADANTLNQFWIGGTGSGKYLANKYSATGAQLLSKLGVDYSEGKGETGILVGNKLYLAGQQTNGGACQSISYNFDGTHNSIFNQTVGVDSFLSEATYGPHSVAGNTFSNCTGVLNNGRIVTVVYNAFDSTYIAEFDPNAAGGTSVTTYPQFTDGNSNTRVKALRVIPGTNNYVVLVYDQGLNASFLYCLSNGVVYAAYQYNNVRYNALLAINNVGMMLGGDNLRFVDITNGNLSTPNAFVSGVQQLVRDPQTQEIYAFTGTNIMAITPAGDADNAYNPDGLGNNFSYAPVVADYWLGVPSGQIYFSDMEMQGSDILISGYTTQLNGSNVASGFAGFVIKIKGKTAGGNPCAGFTAHLDSVYSTGPGACDYAAHITLAGAFPMSAAIGWSSGGSTVTVNSSPYIATGLCPETYEILFEDQNNCTALVNFVSPPAVPCTAPVITNQLPDTTNICAGNPISLGQVTVIGTAPVAYQWYHNTVAIMGAEYNAYVVNSAAANDEGGYYVIATNACGTDTSNIAGITVTEVGMPVIAQNGNQLTATGTAAGATFTWLYNGASIPNQTGNTYTATQSGIYMVHATINGCTVGSQVISVVVTPSAINNLEKAVKVNVYPNPVADVLHLISEVEVVKVEVLNLLGEVVASFTDHVREADLSKLATGIYTAQLTTTQGIVTQRIVKN